MSDLRFFRSGGIAALAGTFALFVAGGAQAADIAQGKEKADQVCAACHGKDGNTPIDPSYPRLAGQHGDYLRHALRAYQTDQRKNPIMGAQAKQLSRADIDNLAAFYASLPGQLSHQR
ncbi:MAG: cytochrome c [Burkholderiaceae bacterium]|nr:cytochrome c [Burkholderiaceae bacterium]